MGKYFDRFPTVAYDGNLAKNLLTKIDFTEKSKNDIYANFDFTLTEQSSRADLLSSAAYNSSYYDWLIYLSNNIIDPYYDFYLNDSNLNKFIKSKYGGIQEAYNEILYYRNNWAADESTIRPEIFEGLNSEIQKYYKPQIDNSNQVIGYVRKQEDWIVSTNKILDLQVIDASIFELKERITQDTSNAKATVIGIDLENNILRVQHVDGEFVEDDDILSITLIQEVIPSIEAPFWISVSAYDNITETNEQNKYISLIKSSYLPDLDKQFTEQLNV